MCILNVVHGVGVVLLLRLLDVEVDHLVARLRDEGVARRVGTHLLEQLREGDHGSLALGHANGNAVAQEVDELSEKHLELTGVAERVTRGFYALDVAMVVGTPDVDHVVDTLELVPVVGDVGGEVGVLPVRLDEDAVLVVTEVGGTEPQCALNVTIEVAELVEPLKGTVDGGGPVLALGVERALGEPHVKVAASRVAGVADALEHHLIALLAEGRAAVVLGVVGTRVAHEAIEAQGEVDDVVATIGVATQVGIELVHERMGLGVLVICVVDEGGAVVEKRLVRLVGRATPLCHDGKELKVALGDGMPEDVHLAAMVVDVVLALHIVASVLEDVAERVAERRPAAMADVEGTDGVRGDELDLVLLAIAEV